jgi:uncharacterized protein (DUF1778 family)
MEVIFVDNKKEKKQVKRNRDIAVTFRANAEEYEMIKRRMAQAGVKNMRAFLLKMAIDGRVIHIEFESVKEMCRLLSNATNNINQIARRINETGNVYAADMDDLCRKYDELWTQTKVILSKVSAL